MMSLRLLKLKRDKSKTFTETTADSTGVKTSQPVMVNRHSEAERWEYDPNYTESKGLNVAKTKDKKKA
jgi:hypothetical protein